MFPVWNRLIDQMGIESVTEFGKIAYSVCIVEPEYGREMHIRTGSAEGGRGKGEGGVILPGLDRVFRAGKGGGVTH